MCLVVMAALVGCAEDHPGQVGSSPFEGPDSVPLHLEAANHSRRPVLEYPENIWPAPVQTNQLPQASATEVPSTSEPPSSVDTRSKTITSPTPIYGPIYAIGSSQERPDVKFVPPPPPTPKALRSNTINLPKEGVDAASNTSGFVDGTSSQKN